MEGLIFDLRKGKKNRKRQCNTRGSMPGGAGGGVHIASREPASPSKTLILCRARWAQLEDKSSLSQNWLVLRG
jgi:hypothetical protein